MGQPARHAGGALIALGGTFEQHAKGRDSSLAVRFGDELLVRPRDTAPPSPWHPRRLVGKPFATRYRPRIEQAAPHVIPRSAGDTSSPSISGVQTDAKRVGIGAGDALHRHVVGRTVSKRCRCWLPVSEYRCRLPFLDRWAVGVQSRPSLFGTLLRRRTRMPGLLTGDDLDRRGGWQRAKVARDRRRGASRR